MGRRREADLPGDDRAHPVAGREALAVEQQPLVVANSIGLLEVGASTGLLLLDEARVGDLTAAFRVERRFAQLRQEVLAADFLERADLREQLGLLVAHELSLEACGLGELRS